MAYALMGNKYTNNGPMLYTFMVFINHNNVLSSLKSHKWISMLNHPWFFPVLMLIAKKTLKFKKHINVISVEKLEIALFPINVFFLKMGISKKTWMFFWNFFLWFRSVRCFVRGRVINMAVGSYQSIPPCFSRRRKTR